MKSFLLREYIFYIESKVFVCFMEGHKAAFKVSGINSCYINFLLKQIFMQLASTFLAFKTLYTSITNQSKHSEWFSRVVMGSIKKLTDK